jgi:OPA family phosphoglycerate-like MFS transporter
MPLAMICMALIFVCLIGYWKSESLLMVTVFAAIVGCLIYVPQFLASVQTMEIVPSFAVGSAVGLRGFMSYIFGASLGTSLFGVMVDKMGWHGGFYLLMGGIVCCILFCYLSHRGALELEQQRKNTQQQEPSWRWPTHDKRLNPAKESASLLALLTLNRVDNRHAGTFK